MTDLEVLRPMEGCRVVTCDGRAVLFGQPPEVLKCLLKTRPGVLESLVLPDVRERGGILLNNVEFLLYFFLFFENGFRNGRRLNIIGDPDHIDQVMEILRLTLLGPTDAELKQWGTAVNLAREWRESADFFALKDENGNVRPVESFFSFHYWQDGIVEFDGFRVERSVVDRFEVAKNGQSVVVDLNDTVDVAPPYAVERDYVPGGLVKFGVEVLGGASGFSPEAPSTGLVLCVDGHHLLIDAIPYVDCLLRARGISINQISGVFLTHLHDDHCNLFPLMLAPHKLDLITTREIYEMALIKLAMGLGWDTDAVREHFNFFEVKVGEPVLYFGVEIIAHHTVHSIPTVGAVFRARELRRNYEICVVGDIQTFAEIHDMRNQGIVPEGTEEYLRELYSRRFDLLVADGGMGPIHGDPADALNSKSERVVFVHVEKLPEEFNATFSLASSGKRYTVAEGGSDIYTTRAIEYLNDSFRSYPETGWLSTLFSDKTIKRFNSDDVIIKQDSETWGNVFLILTGYCEVIHHDGHKFSVWGTREAGDLIGEMAIVTGTKIRNASVVARTPVTVCEFSEATFDAFIEKSGHKSALLSRWGRRIVVSEQPQFCSLGTTVVEFLCYESNLLDLQSYEPISASGEEYWAIVVEGAVITGDGERFGLHSEIGDFIPYANPVPGCEVGDGGCKLLYFPAHVVRRLLCDIPQFNYGMRKLRMAENEASHPWIASAVR